MTLNTDVVARGGRSDEQGAISSQNRGEIEVLNAARNPYMGGWQGTYDDVTDPPANSEVGLECSDVLWVLLMARFRENAGYKTSRLSVNTVLDTTLYRVTINGTDLDYTSDGDATEQEILDGVAAAIEGGAEPVSAEVIDDQIVITGTDAENYTLVVSAELTIDYEEDATSISIRLWGKLKDAFDPNTDRPYMDLDGVSATYERNVVTRINVSGLSNIVAQVTAITGSNVKIGLALCALTELDNESAWE